jgi:hypothetical protein
MQNKELFINKNALKEQKEVKMAANSRNGSKQFKTAFNILDMAIFCGIILSIFIISMMQAYAIEKPVEGYVFDSAKQMDDASIKILMKFKNNEGQDITCLTYPTISTDDKGYFITNLGNLRILGNNQPCEDRWKKGDVLAVIAQGMYTTLPDGGNVAIDSESGSTLSIKKLIITDKKFEPLYSELSLAKMKMILLEDSVNWQTKKAVFNAEVYNPNNVAITDAALKIVVTGKDDRNNVIAVSEEKFGIDAFETKQVQVMMDIKDVRYGNYLYNAVLYTATMTHDRILDRQLELKPYLAFITVQNTAMMIMALVIIALIIMIIWQRRSKKIENQREQKKKRL